MENSAGTLQQQQQAQTSNQKSRKKSKNKKNNEKEDFKTTLSISEPSDVSNQTATTTFVPCAAIKAQMAQVRGEDCSTNGLTQQLDEKLNIGQHNHTSNGVSHTVEDDDGDDCSERHSTTIANGHHASNGHEDYPRRAETPKSKSSQQTNKSVDHCQATKVTSAAATPIDVDQTMGAKECGSAMSLENGFDLTVRRNSKENLENHEERKRNSREEDEKEKESTVADESANSQSRSIKPLPSSTTAAASTASAPAEAGAEAEALATPVNTAQETEKASTSCREETEPVNPEPKSLDLSQVHIEYKEYESELQMHDIMRLIQAELSEPYSIYTYRYFIYNWPKLCFLAAHGDEYVGAIVCKLDMHMNVRRGYIAMLAVRKEYRKLKIGTTLVQKAIEAMVADNADEVVLETEMRNVPALRLYENLGFVRDKRLFRYYLNGVDALRLKLWFR